VRLPDPHHLLKFTPTLIVIYIFITSSGGGI
jgi:hypothetical protein